MAAGSERGGLLVHLQLPGGAFEPSDLRRCADRMVAGVMSALSLSRSTRHRRGGGRRGRGSSDLQG